MDEGGTCVEREMLSGRADADGRCPMPEQSWWVEMIIRLWAQVRLRIHHAYLPTHVVYLLENKNKEHASSSAGSPRCAPSFSIRGRRVPLYRALRLVVATQNSSLGPASPIGITPVSTIKSPSHSSPPARFLFPLSKRPFVTCTIGRNSKRPRGSSTIEIRTTGSGWKHEKASPRRPRARAIVDAAASTSPL